jgi:ArsR family transcriptional regulator
MTDLFDVLADPTRRDIVDLLRSPSHPQREMSVGELVESLGITQPTVSKHLKVLRESGLVSVREDGQHRYYRFDDAALGAVRTWVGATRVSATASPEARDDTAAVPFVDLAPLGRAAGSLLSDVMAFLDGVVLGTRR